MTCGTVIQHQRWNEIFRKHLFVDVFYKDEFFNANAYVRALFIPAGEQFMVSKKKSLVVKLKEILIKYFNIDNHFY